MSCSGLSTGCAEDSSLVGNGAIGPWFELREELVDRLFGVLLTSVISPVGLTVLGVAAELPVPFGSKYSVALCLGISGDVGRMGCS